jgi:hypothetical protein
VRAASQFYSMARSVHPKQLCHSRCGIVSKGFGSSAHLVLKCRLSDKSASQARSPDG